MIEAFFTSPRVVDLVLLATLLEAVVLLLTRRRTLPVASIVSLLLPGVMLMLALRAALAGAWWGWIAAALLGALATHLLDLSRRLSAR